MNRTLCVASSGGIQGSISWRLREDRRRSAQPQYGGCARDELNRILIPGTLQPSPRSPMKVFRRSVLLIFVSSLSLQVESHADSRARKVSSSKCSIKRFSCHRDVLTEIRQLKRSISECSVFEEWSIWEKVLHEFRCLQLLCDWYLDKGPQTLGPRPLR